MAGVGAVLADADVPGSSVERVVHGTTLATNLVLERKGSRLAFAVTAGFRDLIRIPRVGGPPPSEPRRSCPTAGPTRSSPRT